jgi:hypothetical protein
MSAPTPFEHGNPVRQFGELVAQLGDLCLLVARYDTALVVIEHPSQMVRRPLQTARDIFEGMTGTPAAEQEAATGGWMFAELNGKPVDPRRDYQEWRDLLNAAHVRPARLHDARHTAATMLLVLKVPVRAVMDVMGWSEASMASRYMHVPDELKQEIAGQVVGLLWSTPAETRSDAERTELTDDQRAAIRLISTALPPYWQRRLADLLDDDGPSGIAVPA